MGDNNRDSFLAFLVLWVLFSFASTMVHAVTPALIKELALSDYIFGLGLAAMLFTNFLFSPFWGKLFEIITARGVFFIGFLGYALGQVLFAVATNEFTVLLARAFSGVFTGALVVSQLAYVVSTSTEQDRSKKLSICLTISGVFNAFGYFAGGMLGTVSVRTAFLVQIIVLLLGMILTPFLLKKTGRAQLNLKTLLANSNPFKAFLGGREFLNKQWVVLFAVCTLIQLGYMGFEQVFNYYINDTLMLGSDYNGIFKAVLGFLTLFINLTACMWIIRRRLVDKFLTPILLLCSLALMLVILTNGAVPYFASSLLYFAANFIAMVLSQSVVAGLIAKKQCPGSAVMGFYNAVKSFGGIIGSSAVGFIYAYGAKVPFVLLFVSYVLAFVFIIIYQTVYSDKKKSAS